MLKNLKDLYTDCMNCKKCALYSARTHVVFGDGDLKSELMFVGEAPGRDEDMQGKPFVGRAGQLLNKFLEEIGLKREDVYIANIIKCRPPENRVPLPEEAESCLPYLRNQVAIINPKIIVCLGATAMKYIMGPDMRITRDRGNWVTRKGVSLMCVFHPAALLRDASKVEVTKRDFLKIKQKMDELNKAAG